MGRSSMHGASLADQNMTLERMVEDLESRNEDLLGLVRQLEAIVVEELLPNAAGLAIQDFARLNDALCACSKL